nr:transcription factor MYB1R1-like [Tanacetum cinerariifolium]
VVNRRLCDWYNHSSSAACVRNHCDSLDLLCEIKVLQIGDLAKSSEIWGFLDNSNRLMNRLRVWSLFFQTGVTWTEEEHRSFLIGLEKLGKSDWRGISKNYVPSRTPTQVASHAQKYFNRMHAKQEKGKRRSSLFDMPSSESSAAPRVTPLTTIRPPVALAPMVRHTR